MPDNVFRPGVQHPEEWRADLNPDAIAGPNQGLSGNHPERDMPTAYDLKDVHRRLKAMSDDELRGIPVVPDGSWLKQGSTYIDLTDAGCREFTARGDMVAQAGHYYVPKSEVDYPLWNRLIGVTDPDRLDQAGTSG